MEAERRIGYHELFKKVTKIEHHIIGDLGIPGLCERVRILESFILEFKAFNKAIIRTIIGATVTLVIAVLTPVIINFFHIKMP